MKSLFVLFFLFMRLFAAFEITDRNPTTVSSSNSIVSCRHTYTVFLQNPAVSAGIKGVHLGLFYFKPYNLSTVNSASMVLSIPAGKSGFGLSVQHLGDHNYGENQLVLNLSREILNKKVFFGMNFRLFQFSVRRYETSQAWGMDAGLQCAIHPHFMIGFSLQNMNQPRFNGYRDEIPLITRLGFTYQPDQRLSFYASLQKDRWFPASLRMGLRYRINTFLIMKSGYQSYPSIPAFGFEFQRSWLSAHYACQYHFELGMTHFWGISFHKNQGTS